MTTLHLAPRRRYLVRFHPKRVPHSFTDVLIIGGGIAGLRAALEVDPALQVVVVTKDALGQSNSAYAQGGIASVLDPLDDFARHAADTIAAGKGLCDEGVVARVVKEAPQRIRELVEYGAQFDTLDGELALTQEGGHSHRRVVHALGDATGREVMRAIHDRVGRQPNVQIWESTFTIDLLTVPAAGGTTEAFRPIRVESGCEDGGWRMEDGEDGAPTRPSSILHPPSSATAAQPASFDHGTNATPDTCRGALVWNPRHGKTLVWAKQTILATGGAGRLYRETTNPEIATADGHALGFRAGAEVRDMEFVQFHPTVLYIAGGSRHLISEAVRGEGGYLVNGRGERFMAEYDPAGELAPRDVVSRAITDQLARTQHPCVYLDLSHLDPNLVRQRFPHIGGVCAEFGIDITRDRIPVRPGAHYMIGGLSIDERARTTLPGLWAAGEVTSSGLHGANRLGSNSLLEGLVFGRLAGHGASELAAVVPDDFAFPPLSSDGSAAATDDRELNLTDLRNSLMSLMWRNVGIERDADRLQQAAEQVDFWDNYVATREFTEPYGWELQNMLLVARLVIAAATARRETRGVHCRSDFPAADAGQAEQVSITC